jgi:hypothetical protein
LNPDCFHHHLILSPSSHPFTINPQYHFQSIKTLIPIMLFSRLALFAAALFVGADACKCVAGGKDDAATRACCSQLGGNFVNGDDCQAGSISEKLSNFRRCCRDRGFTSDCDCPTCRVAEDGSSDELDGEEQLIATR